MRICIAARLAGGVGLYSRTLLRALVGTDSPPDIHFVTPDPVPHDVPGRIKVHQVALPASLPTHPGWVLEAMAFRRGIRPLLPDVDLIHFTDARNALFTTGLGRPVVGTMNDYFSATVTWHPSSVRSFYRDWPTRYVVYHLAKAGERRTLRRLSRVIAISDAVTRIVGSEYHVPPDRFTTVPYGLDFSAIPANDGTLASPPTVLFVGGNFQRKGLLVLLRALPAVLTYIPDARLKIIGRSHYADGARRLAERLGILDRCDFLGALSHRSLLEYYGTASVLAMPSLIEAFGIPYLEAMSCGLPVVATDCEGPDSYLRHQQNALVVPAGNATALSDSLIRLLRDRDMRDRVRQGGKQTARWFTPERMARGTLAVYRNVLGDEPARG